MHRLGLFLLLVLAACGGSDSVPVDPPPNPLYVSTMGRDTNLGDRQAPLRSIRKAAQLALDGYEIIVAPGTYAEEVTTDRTGTPAQGISLLADVSGARSGEDPGPVVVDVTGTRNAAGIVLSNSEDSIVDGFRVTGSSDAGIVLKGGSDRVTIRNCEVFDNPGDGIRVQDSSDVLVFNNLVYFNGQRGVAIVGQLSGSPDASVVHNTIALNGERGITIGTTSAASPRAYLRNNIVFENGHAGALNLRVLTDPRSEVGYDGDYNLVFPANYDPGSIRGPNDLNTAPSFVDLVSADFHVELSSAAINAGDDSIPQSLRNSLRARTVTGRGPDGGPLDLGYHFLP